MRRATTHWLLRGVAATALVVGVRGGTVDAGLRGTAGQVACTIVCASGSGVSCASGWHKAWETDEVNAGGEAHSSCEESLCYVWHACDPGMEGDNPEALHADVAEVSEAVRLGDTNALLALAGKSRNIAINRARSAVQVLDCRGGVVAHLPVKTAVLSPALQALGID